MLAQLALLYKLVNSFGLSLQDKENTVNEANAEAALTVQNLLDASVPAIGHSNADVKNAATKIILDVQRLSGEVKDHHFLMLPEKQQAAIKEKVFAVQCEKDLN